MRRTVLIVDDHGGFRASTRALLEAGGRFVVVGEAATGTEAVTATNRLQPEVVLLDIALPDIDGFAVCESIMRDWTIHTVVVRTSSRNRTSYGLRLTASPAYGFIPKEELSVATLQALIG